MSRKHLSRRSLLAMLGTVALAPQRLLASSTNITLSASATRSSNVTRWQAHGARRGTILFSHGALSSPSKYPGLIGAWVDAGYDVYAPLHVDSEDHPDTKKYVGFASWRARIEDMRALAQHVTDKSYVAAGHSYGALVALTLGGAAALPPEGITGSLRDPRVRASVAFSPPAPVPKLIDAAGYATLAVPALIQTGDRDIPPGASAADGWKGHLLPYDLAAAGGDRYALILQGVDHYFGGAICRHSVAGPIQLAQLKSAAEISTLFIDAYSTNGMAARAALQRRLADSGPVILRRK